MGELQSEAVELASEGLLPTIVWPSDVDAYRRKVDPDMRATDAAVKLCTLAEGVRAGWDAFFKSWVSFFNETGCGFLVFGCANKFDEARDYEKKLAEWQAELQAKGCALNSPKVRPPEAPDLSPLKWVAGAAALIAIAYIASPLIMGARKVVR
jgi:hypothetical protein